jgi:hypothetical protein
VRPSTSYQTILPPATGQWVNTGQNIAPITAQSTSAQSNGQINSSQGNLRYETVRNNVENVSPQTNSQIPSKEFVSSLPVENSQNTRISVISSKTVVLSGATQSSSNDFSDRAKSSTDAVNIID